LFQITNLKIRMWDEELIQIC